jgi:hypothetical protein
MLITVVTEHFAVMSLRRSVISSIHIAVVIPTWVTFPCGSGIEYHHHTPVSRKSRQKGNPVPGDISVPPCYWGI